MSSLSQDISSFVVSDAQRRIDHAMLPYDIWGTMAHVTMLQSTGIITQAAGTALREALKAIQESWEQGSFQIDPERGAQLSLEHALIERTGEAIGLCAHTARSRNDQVMLTELLYLREKVISLGKLAVTALSTMHGFGVKHLATVMPGYTHMQPGKPTTVAAWTLAHFDSMLRAIQGILGTLSRYDQCPLGAVESYGTSWPIDRTLVAKLLGFSGVWESTLDAISSRGQFQAELLGAFSMLALSISRVATDLMLYTTFEFGLFELGDNVAKRLHPITGSSVMAQKRNPDAIELLRSLSPQISGLQASVVNLLQKLPSAYNRDSREVKEYVELGCGKLHAAILALHQVFESLKPQSDRMRELVIENYSLTTDLADYISQKSQVPYRLVYKIVGAAVDKLMQHRKPLTELSAADLAELAGKHAVTLNVSDCDIRQAIDPDAAIRRRLHIGAPNPEQMAALFDKRADTLQKLQDQLHAWSSRVYQARQLCYKG